MPLMDFLRPWKVTQSNNDECPVEDHIKITGAEGKPIIVQCGNTTYTGTYETAKNCIDLGDYEIRLHIVYAPKDPGPAGGSWTAVDHPTGLAE